MADERPYVVFDTMIFLQAVGSGKGPAFAALQSFEAGDFHLIVSQEVLNEVRDVLSRPEIRRKLPLLSDETVAAFVQRLENKAILVDRVPRWFEYERDPDDEPVLNLAIQAAAQYLVTRDNDLLDLMKSNNPVGETFRERFPGLTILDPLAFLRELPQS